MMVRWMRGVRLKYRVSSEELNKRLGIVRIAEIVRRGRLGWFGHLERKDSEDWVSACRNFEVSGPKSKGMRCLGQRARAEVARKTWAECVRHDLSSGDLDSKDAKKRKLWKSGIVGKSSNPCMHGEADAS